MRRFLVLSLLALTTSLTFACGGDPEPGSDCKTKSDCGALECFCAVDEIPGVCSESCTSDADCKKVGDGLTCSMDFCTGVNVCLNQS